MNIFDPIFFQASIAPHRPAIGFPGGFVTYGQLASGATAAAASFSSRGFRRGELVALDLANPLFQILTTIALGRLGIPSITMPSQDPAIYAGLNVKGYVGDRPSTCFKGVNSVNADQDWFVPKLAAQVAVPARGVPTAFGDTCRVSVSSGTTGRPKAFALTSGCMEHRLSRVTINPSGTRTLSMLGLPTSWGFLICMRTLRTGGMYCFAPFPRDALDLCMFAQIQNIWASPDQLVTLIKAQDERLRQLPSLIDVTIGGSSVAAALLTDATQKLCKNIVLTYGASETGPVASAPAAYLSEIPGAVGFTFPWIEVEIVDEQNKNLGFDREGIVRIRGDDVVDSYLSADPEAEGIFQDGWFYPGDLGSLWKDGLLTIVGRTSEVINRGGVKIAPAIIEDVLKSHPAVADVGVVGATNSHGKPEIWAAIVANRSFTEAELLAHCRPRLENRSPDRFFPVQTIPRNQLGKIMSTVLRNHLRKEAG
jgi:acyl-coenzyme A synthetase/AMP-(fatty) acid ligase